MRTLVLLVALSFTSVANGTLLFDWHSTTTGREGTASLEVQKAEIRASFPTFFFDFYATITGIEPEVWGTNSTWIMGDDLQEFPSLNRGAVTGDGLYQSVGYVHLGQLQDESGLGNLDSVEYYMAQAIPPAGGFSAHMKSNSLLVTGTFDYTIDNLRFYQQPIVGDLNGDFIVDALDAGILFHNWTGDVPPALPEPGGIVWLAIAIPIIQKLSRRRYSQLS